MLAVQCTGLASYRIWGRYKEVDMEVKRRESALKAAGKVFEVGVGG